MPGFVIQGGDPTGTGTGGPGYSTATSRRRTPPTPRASSRWPRPRPSRPVPSGSQFYIVTGADAGLPPDYAMVGKVIEGMDVALAIDKLGDPASGGTGAPLQTILVEKATVDES